MAAATEPTFCRGCGHDLRGLPESRCPECGTHFDPGDPETYFNRPRSFRRHRWLRRVAVMAVAVVVLSAAGITGLWWAARHDRAALGMAHHYHPPRAAGEGTVVVGPRWLRQALGRRGGVLLERAQYIDLNFSAVTDDDLAALEGCASLRTLGLSQTRVTDAGLAHLDGLSGLRDLYLIGTPITDAGLRQLAGMTALETLILADTDVTDAGLEHLRGLSGLRWLNLNETGVTDAGLGRLDTLTGLRRLYVVENARRLTDAGLAHVARLRGCAACNGSTCPAGK